jgi:PKD repeat protein
MHIYNVVSTYDVTLIAGNNSCPADTLIKQNYITVITDINETGYNLSVTAFPVPANNYITIKTENNSITAIKIINQTGKEVISLPHFHTSKTIDIKQLTPGIYFILLFDDENKQLGTLKIIKH